MAGSFWTRQALLDRRLYTREQIEELHQRGFTDHQLWSAAIDGWTPCQLMKAGPSKGAYGRRLDQQGLNLEASDRRVAGYPPADYPGKV